MIYYALRSPYLKDEERAEIQKQVDEFLKAGGKITVIPYGVSNPPGGIHDSEESSTKSKQAYKNEVDISGIRFGKLVASHRCRSRMMARYWVFHCDCGADVTIERKSVMTGRRTSCGCQ